MNLPVTSIVFICLIPLLITLTFRVIRFRRKNRISLGTNNEPELVQRVRAHGNFVEYTPLFLVGLVLIELQQVNPTHIAIIGGLFIVGRYINAVAVSKNIVKLRFPGMFLTVVSMVAVTICLLTHLV